MQPLNQAEFSGRYLDAYGSAFSALPLAAQYGFAIVFGLVIGSFLTVVVHRLPIMLERAWQAENTAAPEDNANKITPPARYNLAVPRSACPHCGHVLRPWENIPVVSYVLLRGRCAKCNAHVSARYPLTELGTALLAALSLFAFGPTLMALAAFGLCATLLATSLIDFDTRYLPDTLTLPMLWAGLIVNLGDTAFVPLHEAVIGAITGYLFLWCVYWLFRLVRGVEGMGYGDFKLLAALGAWLGWQALPQVVLLSAVAGAIFGLAATVIGKMRFEEPLPFGPFLAAGGVITLFFGTPLYAVFG
ncbi:A24 family peptidase [Caballeronia sp. SEWSISQ10-4 2]|uniref:prepilin peptidase n=1 Tax=Caballeronia sp. SEWSISQ10-4 2 TaxID=2937438 RepID=UPI00264F79ED|nr:A24 family peptidase [Caballeronia sp. SEWSISQ10-4 2]MDN7182137.1 A24 family peptidase [Caballeronia sp. SEWSISQ10-4 2]